MRHPNAVHQIEAGHLADAEKLKSFLESHDVKAIVEDERRLQKYWFVSSPRAGVHVLVPEVALEMTRTQLATRPAADVLQKAVRCPSCQSARVHYPAMTRKNILPTLVAHVLVAVRLMDHEFYCEDCHFTWTGSGIPRARRRKPSPAA